MEIARWILVFLSSGVLGALAGPGNNLMAVVLIVGIIVLILAIVMLIIYGFRAVSIRERHLKI